jgi:hypothetical protein
MGMVNRETGAPIVVRGKRQMRTENYLQDLTYRKRLPRGIERRE